MMERHYDTRNVHDVVHAQGSTRSPSAQHMIQEFLNRQEPKRFINEDDWSAGVFWAGRHSFALGDSWRNDDEAD